MVAGYTNDVNAKVRADLPIIVFGDHTRALKFVDFPFAVGADGVKLLKTNQGFDSKFVFYYLKCRRIPSLGYSRHYKRLKEITVPSPPLAEQKRIAAILDRADAIRTKRRQVLAHLDSLAQSIFHDMFDGRGYPPVKAGTLMPSMRNGLSPATNGTHPATVLTLSAITQGHFNPHASKPGLFAVEPPVDKRVSQNDFLICRGNGNQALVGVGTYSHVDRPDLVYPDTVIAGRVDTSLINMRFLEMAWRQRDVRSQLESVARTTNGIFKVNQRSISDISVSVPPVELQDSFANLIASIDRHRKSIEQKLNFDDELFTSLQYRAFRGDL